VSQRALVCGCTVVATLLATACAPAAVAPPAPTPSTPPAGAGADRPATPADTAARAMQTPPAPGPLRPYRMPDVEDFRLGNGLRVVVVRQPTMPLVAARVLIDAGAEYEPAAKNGLAVLTAALLVEGAGNLTGPQLAERMEGLGTSLQTGAAHDVAFAVFTALKPSVPEALRLTAAAVTEPAFPASEFARVQQQSIAGQVQSRATVEGLAAEAFNRALYVPDAPYSRPASGTPETLRALTRDDVVSWHRATYAPARTTLLLVGDITAAEARQLAQDAFGAWSATAQPPARTASRLRPAARTRVILIDRPGSVQSAIRVGQGSIGADDPELFPMTALSHVLGGGFSSRVNQNLRERHGWTYGANTVFSAQRGVGTFFIVSSVRSNATDSAVAESVREYRRIVQEVVPPDELRGALNNLVGSFPASVLTVQGLAQRMQTVLLYGLPLDFYATYREKLAAVRAADIATFGRARVTPDALTIVVAGDLASIEQPIRTLNLGDVEVWSATGEKVR
jgi:zinc protease